MHTNKICTDRLHTSWVELFRNWQKRLHSVLKNLCFYCLCQNHIVGIRSEWICGLQYDWCLHSLLSSSMLLIVLFIVCLCWLMAQGYVRREERLPKVQAGHAVNPSTQSYWLTEVPPQCCYNAHTHPRTHKHMLPFKTHFPQSVHLLSHTHGLFLTWCVCLTFCQAVYQEHPPHNLCVCVQSGCLFSGPTELLS